MNQILVNNTSYNIENNNDVWTINDVQTPIDIYEINSNTFHVILNNKTYSAELLSYNKAEKTIQIIVNNHIYTLSIKNKLDLLLDQIGIGNTQSKKANNLKAPMPGLVLKVLVQEGDTVQKGDSLLILEAMKMENVLKATSNAVIKKVNIATKQTVEKGAVLLVME